MTKIIAKRRILPLLLDPATTGELGIYDGIK
jgi:hypothetical protein